VATPSKSSRKSAAGWLFLAVVACVVAGACFVWVAGLRRSGNPGQASQNPEAQESPPVAPPQGPQPVADAKQEEGLSSKPVPPQPDRQAAVKAEIKSLEKESIDIAETLVEEFPKRSDPLGLLGMVYNRCDQAAKAMEYWKKALDRSPNRPDLYDAMATLALARSEFEQAAELCRKGLAQSAQMPQLHYHLAEALDGLDRVEESTSELLLAVKLAPENADVHCRLGKAYALSNQHEKAKISYETAVKLQPRNAPAQYGLATACAKLGMEDQSKRAMEQFQKLQAESIQPDDLLKFRRILAMTCCDAATVYLGGGMPKTAERLLRRATEVAPTDSACRMQLVQLLCARNRAGEAVPFAKELAEIEPNNAIFHLRLAMIYDHLQQHDEAHGEAQKAVKLAPDDEECRRFLEQIQAKR
jgi:tetratricopeptide (TPR) repeat protein